MKFTQETDYGFRIVLAFSKSGGDSFFTAVEMAENHNIPYRFLLRVLGKLKRAGILQSRQGVDGGYKLAKPPERISLRDVVDAVEGEISINRCLKSVDLCNAGYAPECQVHKTLATVQERFLQELEHYNFANLEGSPAAEIVHGP